LNNLLFSAMSEANIVLSLEQSLAMKKLLRLIEGKSNLYNVKQLMHLTRKYLKCLECADESLIKEREAGGIALDEELLLMFLRCRKWDVQSAFEKVKLLLFYCKA
jgi:hypothetical protein